MRRGRSRGFTLVELLTVITIIGLLAGILMPRYWAARDRAAFTACGQNLKNIATALSAYANDNSQQFPTSLNGLRSGGQMPTLPLCPQAGGIDTYSPSYQSVTSPANFTVFCQGSYHVGTQNTNPNQPYYYYGSGLGP